MMGKSIEIKSRAYIKPSGKDLEPQSEIKVKPIQINNQQNLFEYHMRLLESSSENVDDIEIISAPIISASVLNQNPEKFGQYGFIAGISNMMDQIQDISCCKPAQDPRLFFNISSPSSVFICGSQGTGKSHTLSCLLENCLMGSYLSKLSSPLAALVFYYDTFTSDECGTPCEAAYISSNQGLKVRVLCSPSNLETIKRTYKELSVEVEPLILNQNNLNTKRMFDLMAVNTEDGSMPLYMHSISRILREMRLQQQETQTSFNYNKFKQNIKESPMTSAQVAPLNQRLDTLESFMPKWQVEGVASAPLDLKNKNLNLNHRNQICDLNTGNDWNIVPGSLTIVDLSCPCITSEAACALFNICLSLFLEQRTKTGRIVALDEAHKYMDAGAAASTLTSTLLSSIRLQRHLGIRIFISTQEPTISPKLLDLCSVTIAHRFSSPDWLRCLSSHIAALSKYTSRHEDESSKNKQKQIFSEIVKLNVGSAILFSPTAIVSDCLLGTSYCKIKIRNRVTFDGGKSIMAT